MSLDENNILLLKKIISKNLITAQTIKVYLFGSRAINKNKKYSDVDILIDATPGLSILQLSNIKEEMEESSSPYIYDFVLKEDLYKNYEENILNSMIHLFDIFI